MLSDYIFVSYFQTANIRKKIILTMNDPELKSYTDKKYIKTAGNILWSGCLIALDAVLQVRKGKGRPSIEKYKEAAGKRDRTLLHYINLGYETMHLVMGYQALQTASLHNALTLRAKASPTCGAEAV